MARSGAKSLDGLCRPVNGGSAWPQGCPEQDQPTATRGAQGGYNGLLYDSQEVLFKDDEWHCVEAYFRLNSLDANNDKRGPALSGVVRWQTSDRPNRCRTPDHGFPKMKFNQLLLCPTSGLAAAAWSKLSGLTNWL